MRVAFLRVFEFMMEKFLNYLSIQIDYFIPQKEWEWKFHISVDEINKSTQQIVEIQKTQNGYVRPIIWRGSEMMAISAQKNKINVAIATWEWGSYFDPKLKLEGIRLNISSWRRPSPDSVPWDTKASGLYMICTLYQNMRPCRGRSKGLIFFL